MIFEKVLCTTESTRITSKKWLKGTMKPDNQDRHIDIDIAYLGRMGENAPFLTLQEYG